MGLKKNHMLQSNLARHKKAVGGWGGGGGGAQPFPAHLPTQRMMGFETLLEASLHGSKSAGVCLSFFLACSSLFFR